MVNKAIRELEDKIVRHFVRDALAAGYVLSVSLEQGHDVEDMLLGSNDEAKIMEAALAGDSSHIFVHKADEPFVEDGAVNCVGWVLLVFGNDGYDVISDYTTNLDKLILDTIELAEQYA
jgi:hypothetical protein